MNNKIDKTFIKDIFNLTDAVNVEKRHDSISEANRISNELIPIITSYRVRWFSRAAFLIIGVLIGFMLAGGPQ